MRPYLNLGIIGHPLNHTLSPTLHTHFLHITGLNGGYCCFDIPAAEQLEDRINILKGFNWRGLSVTVPYKEKVHSICDRLDESADAIGAVNCIVFENDTMIGYNTDAYGFRMNLEHDSVDLNNKKVLFLGAGGAAKAAFYVLREYEGVELTVANRSVDKAEKLCSEFNLKADVRPLCEINGEYDVVINSTSFGLKGERFDIIGDVRCRTAVDMQYGREQTSFLRAFENGKTKLVQGFPMLVYQAYRAFELWSGQSFEFSYKNIADGVGIKV